MNRNRRFIWRTLGLAVIFAFFELGLSAADGFGQAEAAGASGEHAVELAAGAPIVSGIADGGAGRAQALAVDQDTSPDVQGEDPADCEECLGGTLDCPLVLSSSPSLFCSDVWNYCNSHPEGQIEAHYFGGPGETCSGGDPGCMECDGAGGCHVCWSTSTCEMSHVPCPISGFVALVEAFPAQTDVELLVRAILSSTDVQVILSYRSVDFVGVCRDGTNLEVEMPVSPAVASSLAAALAWAERSPSPGP